MYVVMAAAGPLLSCTTLAADRPVFYSAEIDADIWSNLREFGEPSLYGSDGQGKLVARYRLTTHGIRCLRYVIRLDEAESGKVRGWIKSRDVCGRGSTKVVRTRTFVAERSELRELDGLFAAAGMFREYPEIWTIDASSDTICVDGIDLLFERRNAEGYGASLANYPCTATEQVMLAAQKLVEIAGAEQVGVF
jgi:hypothetical protein